ncbi:hypothetical protein [uncultured Draconibacterium sp.]|uniref:hypothetical protein n=1 Tax=uncultured Draconibacterium sp. TaxID=1573823 RepID=UPI0025D96D7F|nr:hypothetical protein [uncultured Draconibacterium sp.]
MILPFKTKYANGSETNFVAKIWAGLFPLDVPCDIWLPIIKECRERGLVPPGENAGECLKDIVPKLHTMREDKKDRWRPGMKIHAYVFNRTKNMFQFVPVLECKAIQDVFMTLSVVNGFEVSVDDSYLYYADIETLAINDGFKNSATMQDYFFPKRCRYDEWSGKIIHWTDLKY